MKSVQNSLRATPVNSILLIGSTLDLLFKLKVIQKIEFLIFGNQV